MRSKASILVGLLWCLAILSIVVIGVLHTARLDLLVGKNYGDRIQAHYLALAGVEKAKALLFQDASDRRHSAKNHSGDLYDSAGQFKDIAFGRGIFRIYHRSSQDEGGRVVYGISDEESRLNVNYATAQQFTNLDGMTPDVVAAILDWRDADNQVTPGGAEADYYMSLRPPYMPRNGALQTTRELLLVRGVTQDLLLGTDADRNALPAGQDGNSDSAALITRDGVLDAGWSGLLTVDSLVNNLNASGDERVNVQTADEGALSAVHGITPQMAKAIVAYRNQNQFGSLADLLNVTPPRNQGGGRNGRFAVDTSDTSSSGQTVISEDALMEFADDVTVSSDTDLPGAININTAPIDVLICLPGVDRELAQAIVSYRKSSGSLPNPAWLLKVPGMTHDIFKQIAPLVTARSETFRILSEGKVNSSGARARIQVIIHIAARKLDTLSWREDL